MKGEAEVKLDGKMRKLVFGMNEVAEIEEMLDRNVFDMLNDLGTSKGQSFRLARVLLTAGLHGAGAKGARIESVGNRMHFEELPGYFEACMAGLMGALGKTKEEIEREATETDPLAVTAKAGADQKVSALESSESTP